jgi:hypothetical protein
MFENTESFSEHAFIKNLKICQYQDYPLSTAPHPFFPNSYQLITQ